MSQHFGRSRRLLAGVVVVGALVAAGVVTASVASPGRVLALPGATESTVVPVEPTRVLDTRYDIGVTGQIVAGTPKKLMVTGTITTWTEANKKSASRVVVPAGATAVLLNVTAVSPTGAGYLSIRPGNATGVPATAGLNFAPGDVVANAITVAVPTTGANAGKIGLYYGTPVTGATMDVVIDVVGYTTNTGLLDLVNRVTALETQGVAGPQGPAGANGVNGANGTNGTNGANGDAGPLTSSCSATLRWDLPACQTVTVTVGDGPRGVAFDGTNIWVTNTVSGTVSKIDPDGTVTNLSVGSMPRGVAFDGTNIWVTNYGSGSMSKINPVTDEVTTPITGLNVPQGVAFDGTNIWVTNGDSMSKIDPVTGTVVGAPIAVGAAPDGVAFDGTNIWVTNSVSSNVSKINPDGTVTNLSVGSMPRGVAFDGTNIWVANAGTGSMSKINPVTNAVTTPTSIASPFGVAFDGTNIWVSNVTGKLFKINPDDGTVTATLTGGGSGISYGVAFDGTNIWVTNSGLDTVSKIVPF
ncbi:MAG: YVTN family beta-propeller protein [Ilumatobacter sp.]|jgi:YVTN family beta-propeller protein